jgi:HD-GYP domain-containing protein (c-di-GMP phosphodiesterase class II)
LSLEIAKRVSSKNKVPLNGIFFEHLQIAGLLHDIGKIGIPESILNKNGPLEANEWKKMKEHPIVGSTILQHIGELKDAILGVKYHHENYDGSGYPEGLKGEQIPLIASIIAVADTFDAMTTDRPYRHGLSKQQAIEEIKRVSGKQLNPEIVSIFIELQEENLHTSFITAGSTH